MNIRKRISSAPSFLFKILIAIVFLCPFYIAVCYSFKSTQELAATGMAFPTTFHIENFAEAIASTERAGMPFWKVIGNTFAVTVVGTVLLTIFSSMSAYVIARRKGKLYSISYSLMVLTLLIPIQAYMFPLSTMLRTMQLNNTLTGFLLAKIGSQIGYSVIITTGFVRSIPHEVEQSACVDGAGVFQTFFRIVMPLMRPILLTSIVINALNIWNDFSLAFIVLSKTDKYIVSLLQFAFIGSNATQLNLAFAMFTMSMIPILLLYFFLQRHIIGGITMGSMKG